MARIVGLDIGTTAVRAVLIRTGFRKVEVMRYLSIPLSRADKMAKPVELGEAVRMLWRSFGQPPDITVADLPGSRVSLRTLTLPATASKHIDEVLPFELDSILPFATESAVVDYQPISKTRQEIKLLVAASLREQVDERLKELHLAGVEPRALAAGAAALDALIYIVPELRKPGPFLIADVGFDQTDLCILQGGVCQSARTLSVGAGVLPGRPSDELWRGIQRTVAAYRAEGGPQIERVYVAGATAVNGATSWVGEALGLPVEVLPLPLTPEVDPAVLPLFARASALACSGATSSRHINLRGDEFALKHTASTLRRSAPLIGACALAFFASILFSLYAQKSVLAAEQKSLSSGLKTLTKQVFGKATSDPQQIEKLIAGNAADDPLPRFDGFDVIDVISSLISPDVTHDVMRLLVEVGDYNREGQFELRGTLSSIEQRDAITTLLGKNSCFKDIKTGRTSPAREADRINYQVEAAIRCPVEGSSSKTTRRRSE
jgi:general secretion pathway protein L